jgi:hypothetical protein
MEAQTCINPRVPCVPLFSTSVSTLLSNLVKTTAIDVQYGAHEIKLRESNDVSIYSQVSFRFEVGSVISSFHY